MLEYSVKLICSGLDVPKYLTLMYFQTLHDIDFSQVRKDGLPPDSCYYLVFIAEKSAKEAPLFLEKMRMHGIKCVGGIYPALIVDQQTYDYGILFCKIPPVIQHHILRLEDCHLWNQPLDLDGVGTAILLSDATMGETNVFLQGIHNLVGNQIPLVGGGAGRLDLKTEPCLFTEEGMFDTGGLLILLPTESRLGVQHGWTSFAGPFLVTLAEKNVIHEINWRPALEVYKEVVEAATQETITPENFFDIARSFPLGLFKAGSEYVVRDPFAVSNDQSIVCLTEIPENSVFHILTGNPASLLEAAANVGLSSAIPNPTSPLLLFNCISRVMYLGNQFHLELQAVQQATNQVVRGVATIGEIASSGTGFVEFHNKTIVSCNFLP